MVIKKLFLLSLCVVLLSSCSLLSPVKPVGNRYVINAIPAVPTKHKRNITLMVNTTDAHPLYETSDMAYTIYPYQIDYFTKNQWAEPPASMLNPLIIQTLQRTHHFHAVNSAASQSRYDYVLNTHLLKLEQVFFAHSSYIEMTLRAQIISNYTNRVLATQQFTVIEPAACNTPYAGVVATNRATAKILRQLAKFCLRVL